jgi:hypothetical protein
VLVAYVSTEDGQALTSSDLRAFLRGSSAAEDVFLHPRPVREIPLNNSGKTDYVTLGRR